MPSFNTHFLKRKEVYGLEQFSTDNPWYNDVFGALLRKQVENRQRDRSEYNQNGKLTKGKSLLEVFQIYRCCLEEYRYHFFSDEAEASWHQNFLLATFFTFKYTYLCLEYSLSTKFSCRTLITNSKTLCRNIITTLDGVRPSDKIEGSSLVLKGSTYQVIIETVESLLKNYRMILINGLDTTLLTQLVEQAASKYTAASAYDSIHESNSSGATSAQNVESSTPLNTPIFPHEHLAQPNQFPSESKRPSHSTVQWLLACICSCACNKKEGSYNFDWLLMFRLSIRHEGEDIDLTKLHLGAGFFLACYISCVAWIPLQELVSTFVCIVLATSCIDDPHTVKQVYLQLDKQTVEPAEADGDIGIDSHRASDENMTALPTKENLEKTYRSHASRFFNKADVIFRMQCDQEGIIKTLRDRAAVNPNGASAMTLQHYGLEDDNSTTSLVPR